MSQSLHWVFVDGQVNPDRGTPNAVTHKGLLWYIQKYDFIERTLHLSSASDWRKTTKVKISKIDRERRDWRVFTVKEWLRPVEPSEY